MLKTQICVTRPQCVNMTMTIMLDSATVLFMGRAGIVGNKVRKSFKGKAV